MGLNVSKGNMYGFVSHTWNPIKGKCEHDCVYCYMKVYPSLKPVRLDESEFKTDLGQGNFIFIGSSTDMFAGNIPQEWIDRTMTHCHRFDNTYLFQSKNPIRFSRQDFPPNRILGTTIETNRNYGVSKAPSALDRTVVMSILNPPKMVTIEPILDFDLDKLTRLIVAIRPDFVNIGADSKGHNLPEPDFGKVMQLIDKLGKFTEVRIKKNLDRLRKRDLCHGHP